jgi:hypothetical protein
VHRCICNIRLAHEPLANFFATLIGFGHRANLRDLNRASTFGTRRWLDARHSRNKNVR